VLVMYLGRVAEVGPTEALYTGSRHPYTTALLGSMLSMDPDQRTQQAPVAGDPPNPINPPSGCRFHTRCWLRRQLDNPERCVSERPALRTLEGIGTHEVACHFAEELLPGARRESLIAEAARSSSAFETSDEEAAGPTAPPPPEIGGIFDRGLGGGDSEETHGRI
jgi:peptide/nickel transport system ATP-binding protein